MSVRGLRRGVRCAVLCQDSSGQTAGDYLSYVSERSCSPLRHQDLPEGWTLFTGVIARRLAGAPAGLESIEVQANVGLVPSGGIRLGNRWAWLHGASPRVIVTGLDDGMGVTVDGEDATVGDDGTLQSASSLSRPGAHVIQVGPMRRVIEVVEPSLSPGLTGPHPDRPGAGSSAAVALPPGRWAVVGAVPGQITWQKHAHKWGAIVSCDFPPCWAIAVSPDAAVRVLNVSGAVPAPPIEPRLLSLGRVISRECFAWSSLIYDAAIRHPLLGSLTGNWDQAAARESWKSYARCASRIKRAIRRSHR